MSTNLRYLAVLSALAMATVPLVGQASFLDADPGLPHVQDAGMEHADPDEACEARTLHEPVHVLGDHGPLGFTWTNPLTGEEEHRPGSGVISGDGTAEDPFLIAGWCTRPVPGVPGIWIEQTSAHVRIADNVLRASTLGEPTETGIDLRNVPNATVEDNRFHGGKDALRAETAPGLLVKDNVVTSTASGAMFLYEIDEATVRANLLDDTGDASGVYIADSEEVLLEDNRVHEAFYGLRMADSSDIVVQQNNVTAQTLQKRGIFNARSANIVIEDNRAQGTFHTAIGTQRSDNVDIRGNVVDAEMRGISYLLSSQGTIEDNHVDMDTDTGWGIILIEGENSIVRGNVVRDSGDGIDTRGSASLPGVTIADNHVEDTRKGLSLGTMAKTVKNNTLVHNQVGILLGDRIDGTFIAQNQIHDNGEGVIVYKGARDIVLEENNIYDNIQGLGLNATTAENPVQASHNWWGCPDGPGDPACEDVEGSAIVDPWRSQPVTDQPPEIQPLVDRTVELGETLTYEIGASDPLGLPVHLSSQTAPSQADFTDHGNGSASLVWTPGPGDEGDWSVTIQATNAALAATASATITVVDA